MRIRGNHLMLKCTLLWTNPFCKTGKKYLNPHNYPFSVRAKNFLLFLAPFLLAALLTYVVGVRSPAIILAYLVILDAVISLLSSFLFVSYWRRGDEYRKFIGDYLNAPREMPPGRVAIVIPVFNEDPDTVVQTAIAAEMALNNEDVYVLDDSTKDDIRKKIDEFAKNYGFKVFRRASREGYKAGAVNAWLKEHGENYEFLMILDADQRPLPGIFRFILPAFEDDRVAFVQVPQYYSRLDSPMALAAHLQLIPFLRIVMRARDRNGSAFSLGSGSVFRIKALMEVGGLYEKTVTEDVYTSLLLNERGYTGRYLDLPLVWYGEAPLNLRAYWVQQNRWSSGGFQLLRKLLGARVSAMQLVDYMNGFFYWLHTGPLSIVDVLAPVFFLLFGVYFMSIAPLYYFTIYGSIFLFSLVFYMFSMKRYGYGVREYLYHQGVQFVASLPVTIAFFQWIFHRKSGFNVTPKKKKKEGVGIYHLYFMSLIVVLAISTFYGAYKALTGGIPLYASMVNLFWALWWLTIISSAYYVTLPHVPSDKLRKRAKQTYDGFERPVVRMLGCGVEFEKVAGRYYSHLAKIFPEHSETLMEIARDSYRHAGIYANILRGMSGGKKVSGHKCVGMQRSIDRLVELEKKCATMPFKECLLPDEEMFMYVYAQLVLESCRFIDEYAGDKVRRVMDDEKKHGKMIENLLNAKS